MKDFPNALNNPRDRGSPFNKGLRDLRKYGRNDEREQFFNNRFYAGVNERNKLSDHAAHRLHDRNERVEHGNALFAENSVDEFPRACKVPVAENTLDRIAYVGNHAHDIVKDGNPRRAEYLFNPGPYVVQVVPEYLNGGNNQADHADNGQNLSGNTAERPQNRPAQLLERRNHGR